MAKKWVADNNAVPPIFYDYVEGTRVLATVKRCNPVKRGGGKYAYQYQVVKNFTGVMGATTGRVFATLPEAKQFAEGQGK